MAKIVDKLDNINCTLERVLEVMEKPDHPIKKILEIVVMVVGIFSIVTTVDIIVKWF